MIKMHLFRLSSVPGEANLSPLMYATVAAVGLGVATMVSTGLSVSFSPAEHQDLTKPNLSYCSLELLDSIKQWYLDWSFVVRFVLRVGPDIRQFNLLS